MKRRGHVFPREDRTAMAEASRVHSASCVKA
jgi:hypothetical protein